LTTFSTSAIFKEQQSFEEMAFPLLPTPPCHELIPSQGYQVVAEFFMTTFTITVWHATLIIINFSHLLFYLEKRYQKCKKESLHLPTLPATFVAAQF
jgi:hypothetical protein